jgi:hypothetical protein
MQPTGSAAKRDLPARNLFENLSNKMKNSFASGLLRVAFVQALLAVVAFGTANAGPITVVNGSFETDPTGFYTSLTPTGWTQNSGSGGVFRPANINNGGNGDYMSTGQFPNAAPDGIQVAYETGSISQTTSTAAVLGQFYELDVWAGTQNNIGGNSAFSINLTDGATTIGSFSGAAPNGVYQEYKVFGFGLGLGNLGITLNGIGQTLFDAVALSTATPPPPGPISIVNGSFEADPTSFYTGLTPTGWAQVSGGGGVFRPANINNGGNGDYMSTGQFPNAAPDGKQVAYETGSILQDTGVPGYLGVAYNLNVWAGTQTNIPGNSAFTISLLQGTTTIASFSGNAPNGVYQDYSITGTGLGFGAGNLKVQLTGIDQTLFDDVRLTAVPEPGALSMCLVTLATMGVLAFLNKKRAQG